MKADEQTISKILINEIHYQIPPYQRPYSWDIEQTQQLLDDIYESYQSSEKEYFIGSLITIEKEKDKLYDVVDGQQRLTTLNIILSRILEHIQDMTFKILKKQHIFSGLENDNPVARLSLRDKDQKFFVKNILNTTNLDEIKLQDLDAPQRHLVENAKVVDDFCIGKTEAELKEYFNFILQSVYVVLVTTASFPSAYRLFNVLNARGLPLSNADLIKNILFQNLSDPVTQSDELEESWLSLESIVKIENLDTFFRHYRNALTGKQATGALHEEIKAYLESEKINSLDFLESAIDSAEKYIQIINNSNFKKGFGLRALNSLLRVQYDEWIPALLCFLMHKIKGMSEEEFIILLEKITIQNWVRRLGRGARLTVYYRLIRAIKEGKGKEHIIEIFQNESNNEEFLQLLKGDIYSQPFTKAILLRLEEGDKDESVVKIYTGLITIEHILPQSLAEEYWKNRFQENNAHQKWLHKLGNLTLLSGRKNYQAQNKPFPEKKKRYQEKQNLVSFDMTKAICEQDDWTPQTIEDRHNKLITLAEKIWYIPKNDQ